MCVGGGGRVAGRTGCAGGGAVGGAGPEGTPMRLLVARRDPARGDPPVDVVLLRRPWAGGVGDSGGGGGGAESGAPAPAVWLL